METFEETYERSLMRCPICGYVASSYPDLKEHVILCRERVKLEKVRYDGKKR